MASASDTDGVKINVHIYTSMTHLRDWSMPGVGRRAKNAHVAGIPVTPSTVEEKTEGGGTRPGRARPRGRRRPLALAEPGSTGSHTTETRPSSSSAEVVVGFVQEVPWSL